MATKKEKAPCAECEALQKALQDEQIQHMSDRNKAEAEMEELRGSIHDLLKIVVGSKDAEEKRRQRSVRYLIAIVPMMFVITVMCMLQNSGIVSEYLASTIVWLMIVGITFCAAVIWDRIKK
jgi:hypothetical protein